MSYLVLARKWRPSAFDEVVGQEHITRTLQNAISQDRVAHALLFVGSRGVGKTTCARILARAMNCEHGPTPEPCGVCPACVEIQNGTSVDVFEIDGASNNSVDQIRELRESAKFLPAKGKRKVYIIDEVHMLSTSAFNALLKILEEPPEHVLFVFATTEPNKILDTIISRCQRFDFKRITEPKIAEALQRIASAEGIHAEPAALSHIAREAKGGMRDALSLLDQVIAFSGTEITEDKTREVLGIADRAVLYRLTEALFARNAHGALAVIDELFKFGLDLEKFTVEFLSHLRDLMVLRVCPEPGKLLEISEGELAALQKLVANHSPAEIHRIFNTFQKGAESIAKSQYPKLLLEMTLLRLCAQGPTASLNEVLNGLAKLEQRLDLPLPPAHEVTPPFVVAETASQTPISRESASAIAPTVSAEPATSAPAKPTAAPVTLSPAKPTAAPAVTQPEIAPAPFAAAPANPSWMNAPAPAPAAPANPSWMNAPAPAPAAPANPVVVPETESKKNPAAMDCSGQEIPCTESGETRTPFDELAAEAAEVAQNSQSAPSEGKETPAETVREPLTYREDLSPLQQLEYFCKELHFGDAFLAAEIEQSAYLYRFDHEVLSFAAGTPTAKESLHHNKDVLQARLTAFAPGCKLDIRGESNDGQTALNAETIFEHRKRLAAERRAMRAEKASRDPAVLCAQAVLAAQIVDINPSEENSHG